MSTLANRQLIVVTGKGGVGKTSVAVALGHLLASRGRRTLVLEVDPRENAHHMLGQPPSGGEIRPVGRRLYLQNLRPRAVLDQVVEEQVKIGFVVRRVLASPIYHHFAEGAPGLEELAVLGHALRLIRREGGGTAPELDTVVLDAPATGHGLLLLLAPQLVSEVIQGGPFGHMAGELARFVSDPSVTGSVVVTLAEEMPVDEALELDQALRERVGLAPELLVVNGLYPEVPPAEAARPRGEDPWLDLWRDRRAVNERESRRLYRSWQGPVAELPLVARDRGPELVAELERKLGEVV